MARIVWNVVLAWTIFFIWNSNCGADEPLLPQGEARPAIVSGYFPDRVHEFVFRNWMAVDPAKLARILGASVEEVNAVAVSMGLPANPRVQPEMRERGYVTLIRRNWHLLPYEQLLEMLDMTAEQLSVMLREEDFLWIKLGRVKPLCEPIRYQAPDDPAKTRAAEIKRIVEEDFGDAIGRSSEPRFDFVRQLSLPMAIEGKDADSTVGLRIVYSYVAVYGDPLLNSRLNPYPDGLLARLAASGINGVWMQGVLRDLAPGAEAFPEFGAEHEKRLASLRELVSRAKKHGIGVYLYINEPRGMPAAFFEKHPEVVGVKETDLTAMCTSHASVRKWLSDALAHVFREVPDLAGIYTITASENLTNCASHGAWKSCERCKDRSDADIICEVVTALEEGVHRGAPDAKVLVSDWGWRGHGDAPDMIERIPKSAWLMSVSEWHLPIERGGIKSTVGEYSISAVGPGPRSQAHWKVARESGLKIGTEIQFNNTCEIASLPYLPVMDLVAEHCSNLSPMKLDSMFIGWTMGGYPSPNLRIPAMMARTPAPSIETVLDELALERFGEDGAPHARKAWTQLSNAYREYPFHIGVVYTSPVQWGAANPLYPVKTGYSATMWGIPYDDLTGWRGPYPPEIFAAQFEKMAKGWRSGIDELRTATEKAPEASREDVRGDLRLAHAAGIHFQSVANQSRYVMARDAIADTANPVTAQERDRLKGEIKRVLESEIDLAKQLFAIAQADSRIGFEPSCQYFYLPLDLVEKVIDCRWLLQHVDDAAG
jgi:hypothetical protein